MGDLVEAERDLRGGRVKLKLGDRWDNHTRRVEMLPANGEYKEHTRGLDLYGKILAAAKTRKGSF